jgi:hypothetical protein
VVARHSSRSLKWFASAIVIVAALVTTAFFTVSWSIQSGINRASEMALREQPGDPILALIAFANSGTQPLGERNRAVWALGQLRDRRALPVLEKHYTGAPCDHARGLCQKELRKAMNLIRSKD